MRQVALGGLGEHPPPPSTDLAGITHTAYGGNQDIVYLLDGAGVVVYRSNQCLPRRVAEVLEGRWFPGEQSEDFVLRPSETGILRSFDLSQRSFFMLRERARFEISRLKRAF